MIKNNQKKCFKNSLRVCMFCILLFYKKTSICQIVNIEKERIRNHDSAIVVGKLSATLNISDNKKVLISSDINPHLQIKKNKHLFLTIAQWEFSTLDKSTINNGGYVHLRYNYAIASKIKLDVFTQFQYNKVWNMPLRYLLGAGPRIKLLDIQNNKLFFGPLYMFELQEEGSTHQTQYNHRLSSYVSWNINKSPFLFFAGTFYYQPLIANFNNYRMSTLVELNFTITKHFTFDNRFLWIFDNTKTIDIPTYSYRYTAGFGYKF